MIRPCLSCPGPRLMPRPAGRAAHRLVSQAAAAPGSRQAHPPPAPAPPPALNLLISALLSAAAWTAATPLPAAATDVFLDVSIDAEPAGRLTIHLFDDVPVGAARFADLARDREGVGYVRSRFDAVSPDAFIASSGVASLSYSDVSRVAIAGGETVESLVDELAAHAHSPEAPGAVSLTVSQAKAVREAPVKTRLVAVKGKFVQVEDKRPAAPNGTGFVIKLAGQDGRMASLEETNLAVGELVGGNELAKRLSDLKAAQPTADSPYFKLAKKLGDRRADVAEKYFLRPFSKVVITGSGVL